MNDCDKKQKTDTVIQCEKEALPITNQAVATIRTFEDIALSKRNRKVLKEIPINTDWLPPVVPKITSGDNNGPVDHSSSAIDNRLSPTPPIDWSLKTTLRVTTPQPLDIWTQAEQLSGRDTTLAHRAIVTGAGFESLSPPQQLIASLLSFQFPLDPRPAGKSRVDMDRREEWRSAFLSVYDAYRSGACDSFYIVSPDGSRRPHVAFFGAAGIAGRSRMHAIVTRSTPGLRSLLKGKLGLNFEMPLLSQQALGGQGDQGEKSMLYFEGAHRVHGVFEFLLNENSLHGDTCDVPIILAPVAFVNAALKRPAIHRLLPLSNGTYRFELKGVLPCWVVYRISKALENSLTEFTVLYETDPLSKNLHNKGYDGTDPAAAAMADRNDTAARQKDEEKQKWREPGVLIKEIKKSSCGYSY